MHIEGGSHAHAHAVEHAAGAGAGVGAGELALGPGVGPDAVIGAGRRFALLGNINRRKLAAILTVIILAIILTVSVAGVLLGDKGLTADFSQKALAPSREHPFGTDLLGRDVATRTIKGLALSLFVGVSASAVSAVLAVIVGVCAALGRGWLDHAVNWLIDLTMGIPHTILLILISIAAGRGWRGLLIGVIVTHWTGLARIIRAEVLQLRSQHYIAVAGKLGRSRWWVMTRHILPHLVPQFLVGLILLFPHAIMHESGLTFLGFGMPPEQPAIGIILSEAMRSLSSGMWWLAFFPGLALVILVLLIDKLGECVKLLFNPHSAQE
ncbi:MAG: ABC transporter permease [Actinomycetes bacterium]|jgi:peptide/nickel transport system permease protein|nr:ABC transporter permease [Actinomycetes bacterium]